MVCAGSVDKSPLGVPFLNSEIADNLWGSLWISNSQKLVFGLVC